MLKRSGIPGGTASLALVSAGVALALSGCAAQSSSTQSAGSGKASVSASTSAAPTGGGAGSPTVQPGQPTGSATQVDVQGSAVSGCATADLTLSYGGGSPSGAAGSYTVPIILKNSGSTACTVVGWPGVAALNGGGSQIYQAIRVGPASSRFTLQPGSTAAAVLYAVTVFWPPNSEDPTCANVPNLLVTPPNETQSAQLQIGTTLCVPPALTALSPGSDGDDSAQAAAELVEAGELWRGGATAISAIQGAYWTEAAALLSYTAGANAPGSSGFAAAAQELTQLAALPDAMQSSAQQTESHDDTSALNTFFSTPGLYS
jgi:Protein of unknown function (DUF4232)